jgi:hypothetical protein
MRALGGTPRIVLLALASCAADPVNVESRAAGVGSDEVPRHCGEGEANAALQALEMGFQVWNPFEGVRGQAGLGSWYECQYRLWGEVSPVTGEPWVFCEHDVFLAGSASLDPYEAGFCVPSFQLFCDDDADCLIPGETCVNTHREAAADLALITDFAQFGPVDGPLVEQTLIRTANKHGDDPELGALLWYQVGFITQRPPGTYRSEYQVYFDGDFVFGTTAVFDVVSHAEHEARVAAGTWK